MLTNYETAHENEVAPVEITEADIAYGSELEEPRWSVISYDGHSVNGLSYEKAQEYVDKLNKEGVSGLCIVADEAALRMKR